MASNYPPGVTGSEYEIVGPDYEKETGELCPDCGGPCMEAGYRGQRWLSCLNYDHTTDPGDLEPLCDPDRKNDEERDRQILEEGEPNGHSQ